MPNRVGVFVDISNLYYCVSRYFNGRRVDYLKYLTNAREFNDLYRAYAYGAQMGDQADAFLRCLVDFGFEIKYKEPKEYNNPDFTVNLEPVEMIIDHYRKLQLETHPNLAEAEAAMLKIAKVMKSRSIVRKADWDVGIAMDIVKLAPRLDTVVLGTADGDLAPVMAWAMEQGCKCVVYASGISRELRNLGCACIEIDDSVLST